ncbi:MAG TPA: hypothetical protein VEC12_11290 [Bacteroidia bacterium]|nr:hypothetical protein [Bacteroidia bacterium]
MKKLLVLLLSLLCTPLIGQKFDFRFTDSMHLANGYLPIEFSVIPFCGNRFCNFEGVIDNDSLLKQMQKKCRTDFDSVDFATHILIRSEFGGDCHMRLQHKVYLDTASKTMIWKAYKIYGGCRAGGWRTVLLRVPKPPKGYAVKIDEVPVEMNTWTLNKLTNPCCYIGCFLVFLPSFKFLLQWA